MAFNNWPYTNFQDLNLGWILNKIKEAITSASAAFAKAEAVETEVGTYSQRITDAETDAETARTIAYSVQADVVNAQSDATSAIAIGHAAQSTANAATTTANNAMSIANDAADSAELAVESATTAEMHAASAVQYANLAIDDYVNVGITVFPSNPVQATKNADEILAAVTANKKIKFTLDDSRTGDTHTTYDYTIDPVENTSSDIDINVIFDISVSSSLNKYIVVSFHKVVSGGNTTYSITSVDVSFSGGGGGGTVSGAVLYDTVQSLTDVQKAQARDNIGADSRRLVLNVTESNGVFSVDKTGAEIRANLHNLALSFGLNEGVYLESYTIAGSPPYHNCVFTVVDPDTSAVYYTEFTVSVYYAGYAPSDAADVATVTRRLITHNIAENTPRVQIAADSASIPALSPNRLYVFTGDAVALNIPLAAPSDNNIENEYHFIFNSGTTPTTLTLPNTIRQPDGFTVEANHVYEVSILENNMTAQGWAVTP